MKASQKNGIPENDVYIDRSVREFKRKVKVGAFFVLMFLILALFILFVGDIDIFLKKKGYSLYVSFDTVIGLAKRSYVRMAGLKVGYVREIQLKGNRPEVELVIDAGVEIQKGAKATMATAGLIGEKYVEIIPGEEEDFFQPEDSIPAASSVGIEQLGTMLLSVGEEVKDISGSIQRVLGEEENETSVKDILKNLSSFTMNLEEFLNENRQPISEGISKSTQAVSNFDLKVEKIAEDLEDFVSSLKSMIDENRDNVRLNLEKIQELIEKTEESLRLLNESLEKINEGKGTLGKLILEPDLYQRADSTLGDLEKIVSPLAEWRVDLSLRAEYLSRSQLLKSTFSLWLWPGSSKYILSQLVYDPWLDSFTVSAQGGLRWGALAPRVGILESKVGVGVDIYTLKDRLKLTLEGYDFNREKSPRFRAWTSFAATKNLRLILGIADFTLASYREFFFGLGLGL
jgi:phospholipid/cholesterol/gamma-HCH transport system substrate-binding protein